MNFYAERVEETEGPREESRKCEGNIELTLQRSTESERGCDFITAPDVRVNRKLIRVITRVMCFQRSAAFCARSYRSRSKCKMDFERGTFRNEKISIGHPSFVTNLSRPKLVILMNSSMCKRKPRNAGPPNENWERFRSSHYNVTFSIEISY